MWHCYMSRYTYDYFMYTVNWSWQSKIWISGDTKKSKLKTNKEEKTKVYCCHAICKCCCLVWKEGRFFSCTIPSDLLGTHLASPIFFSLCCTASLPLAPILSQSSCFQQTSSLPLPSLSPQYSARLRCFGAANFPLVHRCPGECCGTVMLSGYPKNVS